MTDDTFDAEGLRAEIEEIDQQLMLLLGLRFRCTDQLSALTLDRDAAQTAQDEQRRIDFIQTLALDTGVSPELAVGLMKSVSRAVADNHERIKASRSH